MGLSEFARGVNRIHFVVYIGIVALLGVAYNIQNQDILELKSDITNQYPANIDGYLKHLKREISEQVIDMSIDRIEHPSTMSTLFEHRTTPEPVVTIEPTHPKFTLAPINVLPSYSREHFEKLHQKLIKPLTVWERLEWINNIWKTDKLPSHADEEPIEILHWYNKEGSRREMSDRTIHFGTTDEACGHCTLTIDKSKEKTADAILLSNGPFLGWIKGQKMGNEKPHPDLENRNTDQFWIFQNKESGIKGAEEPALIPQTLDSMFNLTMSYKRDSDIIRYFGDIENSIRVSRFDIKTGGLLLEDDEFFESLMSNKTPYGENYNTAWFVSNCDHTSGAVKRWEFGKSLIKAGLKLYGEGECFDKVTTRNFGKSKTKTNLNEQFPLSTMKFYLAFENAYHCTDYVSEKFWRNSFGNSLIPIVYGPHPADVAAIAPPNSYIHAELFETPEELVGYVDFLDSNNTAYLDYHQWRTLYPLKATTEKMNTLQNMGNDDRAMCELCRLIRQKRKNNDRQFYQSVMKFWHFDVYPECKSHVTFQNYQTSIIENIVHL